MKTGFNGIDIYLIRMLLYSAAPVNISSHLISSVVIPLCIKSYSLT